MSSDYTPRLSIDITEDQQRKLSKIFPWGTQKKVFSVIIDDMIRLCNLHGNDVIIGAFMQRWISLENSCKLNLRKPTKNGND